MEVLSWTGLLSREFMTPLGNNLPNRQLTSGLSRYVNMIYEPGSQPVIDRLWDETMAEFEFAGARGILESMRK